MKNVVYILVDALCYCNIGKNEYRNSPTPFLDSIREHGVDCKNMFSQGPYTEAAFVSCLGGTNTLEYGGYMKGLEASESLIAEKFQENGYDTISTYSPYIYSKSYLRGVEQPIYSRIFSMIPLKDYRLSYFRDKFMDQRILDEEYKLCGELVAEGLDTWIQQVKDILEKKDSVMCLLDLVQGDAKELYQNLLAQKNDFDKDQKGYLEELFKQWENHSLFMITNIGIENKQSPLTKRYIIDKYSQLLEQFTKTYHQRSFRNNFVNPLYLLRLARTDEKGISGAKYALGGYRYGLQTSELVDNVQKDYEKKKVTISAHRQLACFGERFQKSHEENKSFYGFIHLEDFHLPSMFYSYDIDDQQVIDEEFAIMKQYVEALPNNYRGNLVADLSALYVDQKIKGFYESLSDQVKENTVFAVGADHGFPCNYNPPRSSFNDNFFQDNYHIPMILFGAGIEKKELDDFFVSSDIKNTLLHYAGIDVDENQYVVGHSKGRNYILSEYAGPGCPDILNKVNYYMAFDGTYTLGVKVRLNEKVSEKHVVSLFHVTKDPRETKNLCKKYGKIQQAQELLKIIDQRNQELYHRHTS